MPNWFSKWEYQFVLNGVCTHPYLIITVEIVILFFFFQSDSWNYSLSLIYEFYLISSRTWKLFSVYIRNSYKAAFLAPSFTVLWVCLLISVRTVSWLPWVYTHRYLVQKSPTHSSSETSFKTFICFISLHN